MAERIIVGDAGSFGSREVRGLSGEELEKAKLLEYGRRFPVFTSGDLDRRFDGYFIGDGKVWVVEHGVPRDGRSPQTHAILVEDSGAWGFLVLSSASGRTNAPATVADLEERARRREEQQAEAERKTQAEFERRRASAQPVSFDDLARDGARLTLRQAAEAVVQAGGTLRARDSRLVVSLPPEALLAAGVPSSAAKAARRLYLAEAVVARAARRDGTVEPARLPDALITPAGAVVG